MKKEAREQYMETLREKYLKANKKEKGEILNEYCRNTKQNRKYVIKKFRYKVKLKEFRKKKKEYYDNILKPVLIQIWKIFDYPCGQRLKTILENETERLRELEEIECSDEVVDKLQKISSATIDRKLKNERRILLLKRKNKKKNSFFNHQIPIKTSNEFDRNEIGYTQNDFVEHCGSSASGQYLNTLCFVDICSDWWEGEAIMGKGQEGAFIGEKV